MKAQRIRIASVITAVALALTLFASIASAADLRVPADYPTIQAAVDAAADDDTIHIASGVYTNQVRITSKRLALVGQPGTILRATTDMQPSLASPAHVVPIMEIALSDVTFRGLTFEGERLAEFFPSPALGNLEGILSRESSAAVENCAFYGFRERAPGADGGTAVVFVNINSGIDEVSFRMTGCSLADNDSGIVVAGSPNRRSVNVTIENNSIIGLGPRATADGNAGITVEEGVGGLITGNIISGFSYTGTMAQFPISFGILASVGGPPFRDLQRLEIEGNTLRDNQMHIALVKANESVVRNNRLQGTAPGIAPLGLAVSGTNVTIANNQFEDMPEGIRLLGQDPLPELQNLGDLLGFAVDAQVTSNRFCNVDTGINVQALATATQEGTLLCPFPDPVLKIAPAVLLSWPEIDLGFSLEYAQAPDGPWSPLDATTFLQGAQRSTSVPVGSEHRYFRLRKP